MNERDNPKALPADAVRTRRLERLAEARARIAAAGGEPMSLEEIAAEVAADRAERRETTHLTRSRANLRRLVAAHAEIEADIDALRSARRKPRRTARRVRADRGRAKQRS